MLFINDLNDYIKLKQDLERTMPWISEISLEKFTEIVNDLFIINKGTCQVGDIKMEMDSYIVEQLMKLGYLKQISSDNEPLHFNLTEMGIHRVLLNTESETTLRGYDLFLILVLYMQTAEKRSQETLGTQKEIEKLRNTLNMTLRSHGVVVREVGKNGKPK